MAGKPPLGAQSQERTADSEHLQLLSIFHYVVAGTIAFFSLIPVLHIVAGIAMLLGAFDEMENGNPPPAILGWLFVILPLVFILFGQAMALCVAIAGRKLAKRRAYKFCIVVAAVECTFTPFGTVLGIFTILVLSRPSVKELFGAIPAGK